MLLLCMHLCTPGWLPAADLRHFGALTVGACCRADALANLTDLDLSRNALKGTLSPFWGDAGGFVSLQNLDLSNNSFSGQLPLAWGSNGTFPVLVHLLLSNNSLSGTLPGAWGTRGRWPLLAGLYLQNNDLTGVLGTFPFECRSFMRAWRETHDVRSCVIVLVWSAAVQRT